MTLETDDERAQLLGLSPRARRLLPLFLLILVGLTVWRLGFQEEGDLHEFSGPTMGTTYSVKLVDPELTNEARAQIAQAIEARLATVNGLMSTWDPDSELSRFNRSTSTDPFRVSHETLEVFRVAREVSDLTAGAFDVTVGPLVAAWGFGATDRAPVEPPGGELEALRRRVGYRRVALDPASRSLSKSHSGTVCDLSAIAKGFGVDEVARELLERGQRNFLIDVGGELRAVGERRPGRAWRVAIEQPQATQRSIFGVLELRDASLATSGDYRNYFEQDGVRMAHLIDPRTGRPIAHALASVSVVDEVAVRADALATGLGVLGPDEGYALAEREGLAAYFIVRETGGGLRGFATSSFPAFERVDE